jgi:uncharacterized membrane protein
MTHAQALFALSPVFLFAAYVYCGLFVAPRRARKGRTS